MKIVIFWTMCHLPLGHDKRALLNPVLTVWNPNRESDFYASLISAVRGENK